MKVSEEIKEAFLKKHEITGTKKIVQKRLKKDRFHGLMRRLSTKFDLDDMLENDAGLKKDILSAIM